MDYAPPEHRPLIGMDLLSDETRAVRLQAAQTYADVHDLLPADAARAYAGAAEEYRQSLLANASMPESLTVLAEFEFHMRDSEHGIDYLKQAIRLDPAFAPARHSYGLALVRQQYYEKALVELRRAYELEPANPRYAYVYAVALDSLGRAEETLKVLDQARRDFPEDAEIQSFWMMLTQEVVSAANCG